MTAGTESTEAALKPRMIRATAAFRMARKSTNKARHSEAVAAAGRWWQDVWCEAPLLIAPL